MRFKKGQIPHNKGKKRPKEWSQRQSVSLKKRYADGLVPPNKGKKASEESRKRMSEAQKKRYADGYVHPRKGKQSGEELRKRLSDAHKKLFASGYVHPMQGKHHSEESKQKMSKSQLALKKPPNSGSFKKGEHRSRKTEFKKGNHPATEWKKGDISWNNGAKYVYSIEEMKKYQNTNQKVKFLTPESRESKHKKMKLILMNPKYREKQSKKMKLLWQDPKRREDSSKRLKKYHAEHPEVGKRIGLKLRGKKHTEETRKKLSIFQKRYSKIKFTPEYRKKLSISARKIKRPQRDNKFELSFQAILREKDIEFKDHVNLIGQPDIFIEPNLCIFLDGDRFHANPSTYSDDTIIWKEYNRKGRHIPAQTAKTIHEKDERINNELRTDGYEIIRIWQSEFKEDPEKCLQKILKAIKESRR